MPRNKNAMTGQIKSTAQNSMLKINRNEEIVSSGKQ
jgi:hypothetical protein